MRAVRPFRSVARPIAPAREALRGLVRWLSTPERAKRQLEREYQREATRRLRESGLARA